MVEFIPYLLVLVGWHPDDVSESMTLAHSLYASQLECERAGVVALENGEGSRLRYFCVPAPTPQEIDRLWQEQKP